MNANVLQIILLSVMIAMLIAFICVALLAKNKSNKGFIMGQFAVASVLCVILIIITNTGKPVDFIDASNVYEIKSIKTVDDGYQIVLNTDEVIVTDNILYGTDYMYIDECDIVNKTVLGYNVLEHGDVVVVKPKVENFDELPVSKQQLIIEEYNGWGF